MDKLIPRVLSDSTPGGENGRVAENHGNEVVPFSNLLMVLFFFSVSHNIYSFQEA